MVDGVSHLVDMSVVCPYLAAHCNFSLDRENGPRQPKCSTKLLILSATVCIIQRNGVSTGRQNCLDVAGLWVAGRILLPERRLPIHRFLVHRRAFWSMRRLHTPPQEPDCCAMSVAAQDGRSCFSSLQWLQHGFVSLLVWILR
jgi:hypothetical protein